MDNSGIYCIYFIDKPNEFYIGRSINLRVRLQEHKSAMRRNGHVNSKIQSYYNKYGDPVFEILEYASPQALPALEELYIKEFDSFNNGLNLTIGGEGSGYGESIYSAKHTEKEYVLVLNYLANTDYTYPKISEVTGVSTHIVKSISIGASHTYLSELCPELYSAVVSKRNKRGNSAKDRGIDYPKIQSPAGLIFTVSNIHKFCQEHGLQPQNLHKVLTKQRPLHKGWKLA
jgi:group I intron endonuclease